MMGCFLNNCDKALLQPHFAAKIVMDKTVHNNMFY